MLSCDALIAAACVPGKAAPPQHDDTREPFGPPDRLMRTTRCEDASPKPTETPMFRKSMLALAAVGALGAAALTPTTASAWGWGHHHHRYWGIGGIGFVNYDSCLQKRCVDTRHGPRLRWVNVCY